MCISCRQRYNNTGYGCPRCGRGGFVPDVVDDSRYPEVHRFEMPTPPDAPVIEMPTPPQAPDFSPGGGDSGGGGGSGEF